MAKYINDELRFAIESAKPFKDALAVLDQIPAYSELFHNPVMDKLIEVESALTKGIFDSDLSLRLQELYKPVEEQQRVFEVLGNSLIRPSYYEGISSALLAVSDRLGVIDQQQAIQNMTAGLSVFAKAIDVVNTSWIHDDNIWGVAKAALSSLDTTVLGTGAFSKLVRLEHETSLMPGLEKLTSAAAQIASIQDALGPQIQMGRLLSDFAGFATNQHIAIQKMNDNVAEISWRLEALDAASKLVDRQVKWSEAIVDAIPADLILEDDDEEEVNDYPSVISILPQHIAYSKRKNEEATPEEALETSTLVEITEKGKYISEKIVLINKLCEDRGDEWLFKYTNKVVTGMINMSTMVCSSQDQLGSIIDVLYFVFYENLERMKTFIGAGDNKVGDQKIRDEDVYKCIFNVKTIRNDLRHDLDHGKEKEIRKKFVNIGDCYQHYCKKRPLKAKDFKLLQLRLYDEFISLADSLVEMF